MIGGVVEGDRTRSIGENNFTAAQLAALRPLLTDLKTNHFPHAEILGHRDIHNVRKACPSFDVRSWWAEA